MALHIEDRLVRQHLLDGNFGLEKESLRVYADGTFSHTPHPFPEDEHIVKDFCENQTEINTGVHLSAKAAIAELEEHNQRIYDRLQAMPRKEYLWLFSNPPHIKNESDIPVAVFEGNYASKSAYRAYLSDKYGRYKMTFSGIHVNYSFSEELLHADFACCGGDPGDACRYQEYKNSLYLSLAKGLAAFGWILVAVTAASPVMDGSFLEKGVYGQDVFTGMASVRCSEMGYWNEFAPIFDYSSVHSYADSIESYVNRGLLKAPSELYYPVRLKPAGENRLESLRDSGISHVELRMFDLNPLCKSGVEEKDVLFAQLLMVWLAACPIGKYTDQEQVQAVQNFKNAARYDLKTVHLQNHEGDNLTIADAAMDVIGMMRGFYTGYFKEMESLPGVCRLKQTDVRSYAQKAAEVEAVLDFEYEKFTDANKRYAWQIREWFGKDFAAKAMQLAKERQDR